MEAFATNTQNKFLAFNKIEKKNLLFSEAVVPILNFGECNVWRKKKNAPKNLTLGWCSYGLPDSPA